MENGTLAPNGSASLNLPIDVASDSTVLTNIKCFPFKLLIFSSSILNIFFVPTFE